MPQALGYALGGLGGLGWALLEMARERRADALQEMALQKDQGTFVPVPASEPDNRSFLQHLFGGSLPDNTYDLGNGTRYRLEPFRPLGEEGARALGLTTPSTTRYTPMQHLPLDDTPAGPLLQTLP